jgi:hypothetical protein
MTPTPTPSLALLPTRLLLASTVPVTPTVLIKAKPTLEDAGVLVSAAA